MEKFPVNPFVLKSSPKKGVTKNVRNNPKGDVINLDRPSRRKLLYIFLKPTGEAKSGKYT